MWQHRIIWVSVAAVAALSGCGKMAGGASAEGGPNSQERVTAFKKMMPDFSSMGKMVKGDQAFELEKFKTMAHSFDSLSQEPFKHFAQDAKTPDGRTQDGDALPSVWTQPQKFQQAQADFRAAVENLTRAADSGDITAIKSAYGQAAQSCKACHTDFRRPK